MINSAQQSNDESEHLKKKKHELTNAVYRFLWIVKSRSQIE